MGAHRSGHAANRLRKACARCGPARVRAPGGGASDEAARRSRHTRRTRARIAWSVAVQRRVRACCMVVHREPRAYTLKANSHRCGALRTAPVSAHRAAFQTSFDRSPRSLP
ncbi:hypothetical protein EYA82_31505 [Burkholderia pseudomallei]|nr:hypothetical protein EYA82_31505 [Burkholderia pseudomallei]